MTDLEGEQPPSSLVYIYLDKSASMRKDFPGSGVSRFDVARSAASELIMRAGGKVELILFGHRVQSLLPARSRGLTALFGENRKELLLAALKGDIAWDMDTNLELALIDASRRASKSNAPSTSVLFLTDGCDCRISGWAPGDGSRVSSAVELLRSSGVPVSIVHIAPLGDPDEGGLNSLELRTLCDYTGGNYSRVSTIAGVYRSVLEHCGPPRISEGMRLLEGGNSNENTRQERSRRVPRGYK